ncbi:MAG: ABC transporter substrate-binding protein [Syntrophaceae bacterium]|nr:ABC transporter substrate-binding protein [Syntrophaceae bacterium]
MAKSAVYRSLILGVALFGLGFGAPASGKAAVAPVGQLPTVTVSLTPSAYALPVILVKEAGEWEDFGIQVRLKMHANGEEQLRGIGAGEWEVGIMDPYSAVKGGNEGDLAIVGISGDYASQVHLLLPRGTGPPGATELKKWIEGRRVLASIPSGEHFFMTERLKREGLDPPANAWVQENQKNGGAPFFRGEVHGWLTKSPQALTALDQGLVSWRGKSQNRVFLPAFLVAASSFADTRRTLVIRWLEGYARGLRLIRKNPELAAARLGQVYRENLKLDLRKELLEEEVRSAFLFEYHEREKPFRKEGEKPSPVELFARSMTGYREKWEGRKTSEEPSAYILTRILDELSALRGEAENQFKKTRVALEAAREAGARVDEYLKTLEEARVQLEEARGRLTVIGALSNLERSAEQAKVTRKRLSDFRRIEIAVGAILALYYLGYYYLRSKRRKA